MTDRIEIALGDRSYAVVVGHGLLDDVTDHVALPARAARAAVVTQPPVRAHAERVTAALRQAGLDVVAVEVPDGEGAKDLAVVARVYGRLAEAPLGRDDVVVAVGGGVVGDLAGFVAATWHRGVALVQVPTTLLAQVDAAIGGKTGVNLPAGKNLVGAFHQPVGVVADVGTLATLPRRVRIEGLAEVVKCGLSHDPTLLQLLEADPAAAPDGDVGVLTELVRRTAAVKAAVVSADEREAGERAYLNLGHTYGHALEAATGYGDWLHGEAVAVGLCVALRLGSRLGVTPPELIERTEALLGAVGLPVRGPVLDRDVVWSALRRDKKAGTHVHFVVLEDVGAPTLVAPDVADIDAAIAEVSA